MKVLVLGGTLFLGRHLVDAALAQGHEVTLFNRGLTHPELYPHVEQLRGDRDGDLRALRGRDWDAVVDNSGYMPRVVRASVELLADSVDRYVFVSTCSVYADTSRPGTDEAAPLMDLADDGDEDPGRNYGALKARCERVVEELFPDRSVIVRPGLIVGPHDPTNRFTYWVTRIAEGGRVLAPEPRDQPVQFIDARDLTEWMLRMIDASGFGVYNATGPRSLLTMQDMLQGIHEAVSADAELVWVEERLLLDEGIQPWNGLPLWLAPDANPEHRGFLALDIRRAVDAGLTFRPLAVTARDTLEWARSGETAQRTATGAPPAGLSRAAEAELLDRWEARRRR